MHDRMSDKAPLFAMLILVGGCSVVGITLAAIVHFVF